jgi:hypothetical protein
MGLVIVQTAVVAAIALMVKKTATGPGAIAPRLAGALVAGIGLAVLVQ